MQGTESLDTYLIVFINCFLNIYRSVSDETEDSFSPWLEGIGSSLQQSIIYLGMVQSRCLERKIIWFLWTSLEQPYTYGDIRFYQDSL